MKKRVYLYVTPYFPSPESWRGGYCLDAAKAIIADGRYDVRVMLLESGGGGDYDWDGIRVNRVRWLVAPSRTFPFLLEGVNNRRFRMKLSEMGLSPADVAVCHVNTIGLGHYAAYMKRLNPATRTIIQLHSSYSVVLSNGRMGLLPVHATLMYLWYRRIIERVDMLAFVSKMSRDTFGKRFVGTPEGEVRDVRSQLWLGRFLRGMRLPERRVVYNGVDTKVFNRGTRPAHDGFVIGCVANYDPFKSHITLLEAAKLLKGRIEGLKIRMIGSGPTLPLCKDYAKRNGLNGIVSFENEIDHRALAGFYRSLDLFVMPSRVEGFLCVCAESQACGTPSMFCRTIAFAELVPEDEKIRWCFEPMDAEDLSEKILAYRRNKWEQHFSRDLEIHGIWREFLDSLEEGRRC